MKSKRFYVFLEIEICARDRISNFANERIFVVILLIAN